MIVTIFIRVMIHQTIHRMIDRSQQIQELSLRVCGGNMLVCRVMFPACYFDDVFLGSKNCGLCLFQELINLCIHKIQKIQNYTTVTSPYIYHGVLSRWKKKSLKICKNSPASSKQNDPNASMSCRASLQRCCRLRALPHAAMAEESASETVARGSSAKARLGVVDTKRLDHGGIFGMKMICWSDIFWILDDLWIFMLDVMGQKNTNSCLMWYTQEHPPRHV